MRLTSERLRTIAILNDHARNKAVSSGDVTELMDKWFQGSSISHQTVLNNLDKLEAEGLVEFVGTEDTQGRPAKLYTPVMDEMQAFVHDHSDRIRDSFEEENYHRIDDGDLVELEVERCPNCKSPVVDPDRIVDERCDACGYESCPECGEDTDPDTVGPWCAECIRSVPIDVVQEYS